MTVIVTGRKMSVSDSLREYAEEKVLDSMKVMDIDPLEAEVVLFREKNPSNPRPAVCEVTLFARGHVIRVEEREEDLHAAIDVAAAKVLRQLRKFKTKVIDRRIQDGEAVSFRKDKNVQELDLDSLMDELSAEDEEVVRVKKIDYTPLTVDEALVSIDLLGHDFFVFTERDTNLVSVLYRRNDGGYGLIQPKEEEA